jgi:hypothetical protein
MLALLKVHLTLVLVQIQPQLDTGIAVPIPIDIYEIAILVIVAIITSRIAVYIGRVVMNIWMMRIIVVVAMVM